MNQPKPRILLISDVTDRPCELQRLLEDRYEFLVAANEAHATQILLAFLDSLSVLLIEASFAVRNDYQFLKQMKKLNRFQTIPILLFSDLLPSEEEIDALNYDVMDFLIAPYHKRIVNNRITNAIRSKDSASFYEIERMLKALPSNIYLKDAEGKYIFSTHYWFHKEHPDDPDWSIRGKTDVDLCMDKENAVLAMEADMEILTSGKGSAYMIQIPGPDGIEYYDVLKEPVRDTKGNITGIVGLVNNVTEHELLKQKLKSAAEIDRLTGLLNRGETQRRMEQALVQLQENGTGLSVIMIDIDNFKAVNDTYGHKEGDEVLITLAGLLRQIADRAPVPCAAGRWGGEEFMLLAPDADAQQAEAIAEEIRTTFAQTAYPAMPAQTVSLGVTAALPEDTLDTLSIRVDSALYQAKKNGKNRYVTI